MMISLEAIWLVRNFWMIDMSELWIIRSLIPLPLKLRYPMYNRGIFALFSLHLTQIVHIKRFSWFDSLIGKYFFFGYLYIGYLKSSDRATYSCVNIRHTTNVLLKPTLYIWGAMLPRSPYLSLRAGSLRWLAVYCEIFLRNWTPWPLRFCSIPSDSKS